MKNINLPINIDYLSKIPVKLNIDFRNRLTFTIDTSFEIVENRSDYCIDEIIIENGDITIKGWIIDKNFGLPPLALMVAKGNQIIKTSNTFISRPDVSNIFNTNIDEFGFNIALKISKPGIYNFDFWALLQDKKAIFIKSLDLKIE